MNSLICKDEIADYAMHTAKLLTDHERLEFMKMTCFRDADFYLIEKMSANFHQVVLRALETQVHGSNWIASRS